MFDDVAGNFSQICLQLQLIVAGVGRQFVFPRVHDREDAQSIVLIQAIEAIGDYAAERGNAFAYFQALAWMRWRDFGRNLLARARRDQRLVNALGQMGRGV